MFLSDATIRRWCGPRWRIARRAQIRDLGVLAELQASQLDRLVENRPSSPGRSTPISATADAGELRLEADGVSIPPPSARWTS